MKFNVTLVFFAFFLFLSNASAESPDERECKYRFHHFNDYLTLYEANCPGQRQEDPGAGFYFPRSTAAISCPRAKAEIRSLLRIAVEMDCPWSEKYNIDSLKPR